MQRDLDLERAMTLEMSDYDHRDEGPGARRRGTWSTEARDLDHRGEGPGPQRRGTWTTEMMRMRDRDLMSAYSKSDFLFVY